MGRVVAFAYRKWATELLDFVILRTHVPIEIYDKPDYSMIGDADLVLFYGWSWIVPAEIINKYLCLCLHPSPLPKYRGGSPLQNQIIAGETVSAVSIFKMTEGLDDGPLCSQAPFSLEGSLQDILDRITVIGVDETVRILENYLLELKPMELHGLVFGAQEGEPSFCKRRTPAMSVITQAELAESSAEQIYNKVRALQDPYPNAYIVCGDGSKLFIKEAYHENATERA